MRFLTLLLLLPASLSAWGCEGHQMVALIARAHLNPRASAAVNQLLAAHPLDPALKRFCADHMTDKSGLGDPLADASTWADDSRNIEKNALWHYVDIPRAETNAEFARYCAPVGPAVDSKPRPGCVASATEYELGILKNPSAPEADRATALRYVVHFIGDLHQPLHTTDNSDHGGNCTQIQFYDLSHPTNLHAIWDYNLIEHDLAARHVTVVEDATQLDRRFADNWPEWGQSPVAIRAWVWEGHAIANDVVYGKLTPSIPIEAPSPAADCPAETQKVRDLHISIGDAYADQVMPTVERQIAKAGYRLADVLNNIWP